MQFGTVDRKNFTADQKRGQKKEFRQKQETETYPLMTFAEVRAKGSKGDRLENVWPNMEKKANLLADTQARVESAQIMRAGLALQENGKNQNGRQAAVSTANRSEKDRQRLLGQGVRQEPYKTKKNRYAAAWHATAAC